MSEVEKKDYTTMAAVLEKQYQNSEQVVTITKNTVTAAFIKTLGLLVGDQIQMGPNAKITWANVTNQPSIPTDTNDLTNGAGYTTMSEVEDKGYQNADQVGEIANSAVKNTKDELDALKKNIGYTQIGSDYVVSPKIVGAYGEFTKAFNVDVVNPSTGLNQSFWAQDAETGTKISGNYSGNNVDNNLTVNAEGANLFSNVGGHTSGVGCGGGYASVSGEAVNISGTNVDITANNLTLNGVETVFGSKTYWDNSTWHWRQWTDGFLELWGNAKVTISTADKYGNLFFTSGYVYLPSGVTAIVGTTASVYSQGGLFFVNFTNWSSTKLDFYICSANIETNKTVWLQFYVIGKWK